MSGRAAVGCSARAWQKGRRWQGYWNVNLILGVGSQWFEIGVVESIIPESWMHSVVIESNNHSRFWEI